jgi:hypothetical protein
VSASEPDRQVKALLAPDEWAEAPMLIPRDRIVEVSYLEDEHDRARSWFPLIREYGDSVRELLAGVVQFRPFEPDRHVSAGLALAVLKKLEAETDSTERKLLLAKFRVAFSGDEYLLNRANETYLVLLAIDGEFTEPSRAATSSVQLHIMAHPCARNVLEYFSEHGCSKRVRHLAFGRLLKLMPG